MARRLGHAWQRAVWEVVWMMTALVSSPDWQSPLVCAIYSVARPGHSVWHTRRTNRKHSRGRTKRAAANGLAAEGARPPPLLIVPSCLMVCLGSGFRTSFSTSSKVDLTLALEKRPSGRLREAGRVKKTRHGPTGNSGAICALALWFSGRGAWPHRDAAPTRPRLALEQARRQSRRSRP